MLDRESLTAAAAELFATSAGAEVASAFLFGSWAEGREHRESDVDLAVLLKSGRSRRQRFESRLRLIADLIAVLHHNEIDLVVLNDAPPLFARRVVLEGERIYCGDREADHAFRRDIQLRAADLEPFIERGRRALLAAVTR